MTYIANSKAADNINRSIDRAATQEDDNLASGKGTAMTGREQSILSLSYSFVAEQSGH